MTTGNESGGKPTTLLRAAWIAPMDGPLIRDGGVLIRGDRIAHVGSENISADEVIDLGEALLTPGLINAHVHLELSEVRAGTPPAGGFSAWLLDRIKQKPVPFDVEHATQNGIKQCLRFGVTTVGDITRQPTLTRPILSRSSLRAVSYGEVTGMAGRRGNLETSLSAAADERLDTDKLFAGVSPHAPYSVESDGYLRCRQIAKGHGMPIATHLAESSHEAEFLEHHTGPFRQLWETIGAWDDQVPSFKGGPIRFAQALGLIDYPTLLAHVNYCDDDELAFLAKGRASVVYCPRTHKYFGHPPHRWREMLAAGINVAVGTDSCASSPDLNLMDDLRLMNQIAPEVSVEKLFEMATVRAAKALQMDDQVGTLTSGKFADVVAWPASSIEELRDILEMNILPSAMWIGGMRVVG